MTIHKKMARSERAKQFMPFAALKGYPEALRKEEEKVLRAYGDSAGEEKKEQKSVKTEENSHRQNKSLSL